MERLELSREISLEPKSSASTNSATPANILLFYIKKQQAVNFSIYFFIQASCYLLKGSPLQYYRRYTVSQLSSEWISVVPVRYKHQDD